ncbi:hypothetical protein TCAL_11149 [Tigriopus californicus]|uniref:15-oxoprostaglandin 13-reductase n=1 Tax=Tigriopus californicus TaxID=6832 RepID=A0A553N8F3_TIGCA|nr:hypothetical protein TCAL_11149 [Tigriopus californicus]|eukprot:TCALIF_11149-PA protein Name:"Similar to PTGR1 Prostaglandin reductase 1 (Bos taurus)" AED:0.06 eAED:0.06 QI:0/0/0/1/1/1/3/0/342
MPVFKQWLLSRKCHDLPCEEDFEMHEEHTVDLRKGQVLCRALFMSVDPIVRLYMAYGMRPGDLVPGRQVARIVESRNKEFPKGKAIFGNLGWQTYSIVDPDSTFEMSGLELPIVENLPRQLDNSGLPKSACLGVLGIPGLIAYMALFYACKVRGGETIVISSAAGQVGHIMGQIAKYLGLKVIGYTGNSDKVSWIKTDLGFDWAFNYKTQDLRSTLKIAAPAGVDIFIDSVGGVFHNVVLESMAQNGRVCILGNLASYNNPKVVPMVPAVDMAIALKELRIFGFNVFRHFDRKEEALDQLLDWCKDGIVQPFEETVEGFENLAKAFVNQMEGKSQGKVIVRV